MRHTYLVIAHSYGIFLSKFINIWGSKNTLFTDFVLINMLNRMISITRLKIYILKSKGIRKTAGKFVPFLFVKKLPQNERLVLSDLLDELGKGWNIQISRSKHIFST